MDWNAPAQLDGLPYTNWKRRSGYTETGTLARMVERWLRLPWNIQSGCLLRWEATEAGEGGSASANGIGSLVLRVGLPPQMLVGRSRLPTTEEIERMWEKPVMREGKWEGPRPHFNPDPHKTY